MSRCYVNHSLTNFPRNACRILYWKSIIAREAYHTVCHKRIKTNSLASLTDCNSHAQNILPKRIANARVAGRTSPLSHEHPKLFSYRVLHVHDRRCRNYFAKNVAKKLHPVRILPYHLPDSPLHGSINSSSKYNSRLTDWTRTALNSK